MRKTKADLRRMRQAARASNADAARALLRLYGFGALAREIKNDMPFSGPVRRQVNALTAGTGEGDQPGPWEFINERGEIESDVLHDPPAKTGTRPPAMFED